jgi:Trypsin
MVRIQCTATSIQRKIDSARIASTQVGKAALSRHKPIRNWSGWAGQVARDVGFKASIGVSSLGVVGAAISEKHAVAGIISSYANDADAVARGVLYSAQSGGTIGRTGAIRVESDTMSVYSSVTFIDPLTAVTAAHPYSSIFGSNQRYTVFTGSNYNSGPFVVPSEIIIHPLYGGSAGQGIDLAVLKFSSPISNIDPIVYATSPALAGEVVWTAGVGKHGNPIVGYIDQDGNVRAGTSTARDPLTNPPLLGADPRYYQNTQFIDNPLLLTAIRPAFGDSSGPVFKADGSWLGISIGGSNSASAGGHVFLNVATTPLARDFVESFRVVPEPTSLSLVSAAAGGILLMRRRGGKS